MSYRIPAQNIPVTSNPMGSEWYRYFSKQYSQLGGQGAALKVVTPTASPCVYQAPSNGSLIVSGGTVSQIAFSRDGSTYYSTGQTAGMFPMFSLDYIKITYTVIPTVVFAP